MHVQAPRPRRALVVIAFAAIYLVWGSTYIGIRFAVESIPPFALMGARSLAAAALLFAGAWALALLKGVAVGWPSRREWGHATVAGLILFGASHSTLALAGARIPSSVSALGYATLPIWFVILQAVGPARVRPTGRMLLGIAIGFAGVAILVGDPRGKLDVMGIFFIEISALTWALGSLYARAKSKPESGLVHTGAQLLTGGVGLVIASVVLGEQPVRSLIEASPRALWSLAYLVVFGSVVAFTAFNWLMGVASPSKIGTYAYVNPAVAMLLGWWLGNESLSARMLAALVVILGGVAMVTTGSVARPAGPSDKMTH